MISSKIQTGVCVNRQAKLRFWAIGHEHGYGWPENITPILLRSLARADSACRSWPPEQQQEEGGQCKGKEEEENQEEEIQEAGSEEEVE